MSKTIYVRELPKQVQRLLATLAFLSVLLDPEDNDDKIVAEANKVYQNVLDEKIVNIIGELQELVEDEILWKLQYMIDKSHGFVPYIE